jgi:hypothetical protein
MIFPKSISGKQNAMLAITSTTAADRTKCQRNALRCPRKDISPAFFVSVLPENIPMKARKDS